MAKDTIEAEFITRLGNTLTNIDKVNRKLDETSTKTGKVNKQAEEAPSKWAAFGKGAVTAGGVALAALTKVLNALDQIEKKNASLFGKGAQSVGEIRSTVRGLVGQESATVATQELLLRNRGLSRQQIAGFLGSFNEVGVDAVSPQVLQRTANAFAITQPITGGTGTDVAALGDLFRDLTPEQLAALSIEVGGQGGLDKSTVQAVRRLQAGGLAPEQALSLALSLKRAQAVPAANTIAQELLSGQTIAGLASGSGSTSSQRALQQIIATEGSLDAPNARAAGFRAAIDNASARLAADLSDPIVLQTIETRAAQRQTEILEEAPFLSGRGREEFRRQEGQRQHLLRLQQSDSLGARGAAIGQDVLGDGAANFLQGDSARAGVVRVEIVGGKVAIDGTTFVDEGQ